jgi:hypothetical protein
VWTATTGTTQASALQATKCAAAGSSSLRLTQLPVAHDSD